MAFGTPKRGFFANATKESCLGTCKGRHPYCTCLQHCQTCVTCNSSRHGDVGTLSWYAWDICP